jgi:glucose-6-phosphate isomerase, archaeal
LAVGLDPITGRLSGPGVTESARTLGALAGVYRDEAAQAAMDQNRVIYRVQAWEPQPEGVEGAVCLATTFLEAGKVGDEYFMTRGHFHANQDRAELEVTISGEGALVLMTADRQTRIERMRPGSVHHVPPGTAHRVANTGGETLVFVSYWASETGHDYETIKRHGFGARVREVSGRAELVSEANGAPR